MRTSDQSLGVPLAHLTHQAVEDTGQTGATAGFLFGVGLEALERALRRSKVRLLLSIFYKSGKGRVTSR